MTAAIVTARAAGYAGCGVCGRACPTGEGRCGRCGANLPANGRRSLATPAAWLLTGAIFYVPANLYPMLISTQLGQRTQSTIVGGAIELASHGAIAVAAVVMTASVLIPLAKFWAVGRLILAASGRAPMAPHAALRLYEVVEFVGRWSMIDVFVVAILAALVRLGALADLAPGPAAPLFAMSVAATMMAARGFDPRLIWDRIDDTEELKA